ncbi:MAG: hypothetical protein H6509_13820 [Bryobacterales bacterium]|nr:hypothetical protein [Acidobacteriota bacterium]MCB9385688.1 hypothetical protein [Bryobacterales bacterium]
MLRNAFVLALAATAALPAAVTIEKTQYAGHAAYRMANADVELIVTADVGPRILRYSFVGGRNVFKEISAAEEEKFTGDQGWKLYGGHRIWVGPEEPSYTYAPDNEAPEIVVKGNVLKATSPTDVAGIRKEIEVELANTGSAVRVTHRLTNETRWPLRFAAWALSMMDIGGVGVTKFPPRGTHPEHLQPANPLVMWRFTNFSDPRWTLLDKYLVLRGDPGRSDPEKAGLHHPEAITAGYLLEGNLFVKRYKTLGPASDYPDMGSAFETFTSGLFVELETLGPMRDVAPGQTIEHREDWTLFRGVTVSEWTDAGIDAALGAILQ